MQWKIISCTYKFEANMHTGEKFRLTQHLLKKIKSYELNLSPPLEPKYHFFLDINQF